MKKKNSTEMSQVDNVSSTRRNILGAGAAVGLGSVFLSGAIPGSTQEALAATSTDSFAPPPSGADDSAILKNAITTGKYLRAGRYRCDKPLDVSHAAVMGIPGFTSIAVNGASFIDSSTPWGQLHVSGISFEGNPAATDSFIRNRFNGTNVGYRRTITDCFFRNYRRAAICMNQVDNPYVAIERNEFWGANDKSSVGVALNGGNDGGYINNNAFFLNKIAVAISAGGCHVRVVNNDILSYSAGTNRIGVWVVPVAGIANSGMGFTCSENKFGNENRDASDYAIVYADKGASLLGTGRYFGDFGPALRNSSGYIGLHNITNNDFSGQGATQRPPIVSWTKNLFGSIIGPNVFSGTAPNTELWFAGDKPTSATDITFYKSKAWYNKSVASTNANMSFVQRVG